MRVGLDVLRRFVDLPEPAPAVRRMLDEQGVEVKRVEEDDVGTVYSLELLANRGDHYCYEGVARELDGTLGRGLTLPEVATLEVGASPWELRCETDLCMVYTATLLERSGAEKPVGAAPMRVLAAAGVHSLQAPIDASNIANLELGQPTHAFDADTLEGPITIRLSRAGEMAWPLFAEAKVELPVGTLVIADDAKILAVAGVIGCEESKTTEKTTRMLLESATFDPVAVRKASRALGIHTDSSARFERGSDPVRPLVGAGRVVAILEAGTGWKRVGTTGVVGDWTDPERTIALDPAAASALLEVSLDVPEITERLARYGFSSTTADDGTLLVRVPPWRLWDVEFADDLYEELAKSVGYENTPITLPNATLGAPESPRELRRDRVEEVFLGHGFFEVFTDGFYGRRARELLGLTEGHPLYAHVETTNALDRAYSLLKNNALHQALEAAALNERRRTTQGRMYEWTRTFHPRDAIPDTPDRNTPVCDERELIWAMTFSDRAPEGWSPGAHEGVWLLKGIVEELGVELGLPLGVGPVNPDHPLADLLHPGRSAAILLGEQTVGILGEVHPGVARRYKLKRTRPCYLEIDASAVLSEGQRAPYHEPPDHQPILRSIALEIPRGIEAGQIMTVLRDAGPPWLKHIRAVDVFAVDGGASSVTFQLVFSNDDNQRSADEVNEAAEAMVARIAASFDGSVVQR